MKKTIPFLVVFILFSCGSKNTTQPIIDANDTSQQKNNTIEKVEYSIKHNNEDQYLSYGSVLGKPFDTIMFADTLIFYCNNEKIHTEYSENGYLFYKHNKHWPKQVISAAGETIFLVERSLGEPEGSDIVGFIMKDKKYIKKVVMNKYKWWNIENDKDYTVKELQDIIKDFPFE